MQTSKRTSIHRCPQSGDARAAKNQILNHFRYNRTYPILAETLGEKKSAVSVIGQDKGASWVITSSLEEAEIGAKEPKNRQGLNALTVFKIQSV